MPHTRPASKNITFTPLPASCCSWRSWCKGQSIGANFLHALQQETRLMNNQSSGNFNSWNPGCDSKYVDPSSFPRQTLYREKVLNTAALVFPGVLLNPYCVKFVGVHLGIIQAKSRVVKDGLSTKYPSTRVI